MKVTTVRAVVGAAARVCALNLPQFGKPVVAGQVSFRDQTLAVHIDIPNLGHSPPLLDGAIWSFEQLLQGSHFTDGGRHGVVNHP